MSSRYVIQTIRGHVASEVTAPCWAVRDTSTGELVHIFLTKEQAKSSARNANQRIAGKGKIQI